MGLEFVALGIIGLESHLFEVRTRHIVKGHSHGPVGSVTIGAEGTVLGDGKRRSESQGKDTEVHGGYLFLCETQNCGIPGPTGREQARPISTHSLEIIFVRVCLASLAFHRWME
jgi:hypothetical protein